MLTQLHRFHGHGSLRYVYKNGTAARSQKITIKAVTNPRRKHSRFAVVVSKKVLKSAVGRNRIRRRVYEVLRSELPKIQSSHDIVVLIFSSEVISMPADELTAQIQDQLAQLDVYSRS